MSEGMPHPVHNPWPRLKGDWAVHDASQDTKLLFHRATKDFVLDDLERLAVNMYGVSIERVPEVFGKAESRVWQEMEANGEA